MIENHNELGSVLDDRDIIVCVGTGGVGKTTTSAAIGLKEAMAGKNVLVLTIDPARRLADALGISKVGSEEIEIPIKGMMENGEACAGKLSAMMLEAKRTFDQMVERYASSPEVAASIFKNPFYQHVSGALSGSQEYMAIEKLSELHDERKYDLIVLDTPPSANALDFFTAPERMMAFLDQSVLQWFLKPYMTLSRMGFKTFRMTSRAFLKTVEKLIGGQVIQDILDFFEGFDGMYEGFKQRAETVDRVLRRGRTGFVLVATPSRMTLDEARIFMEKLKNMGMPLVSVVINRATLPPEGVDLSFLDEGPGVVDRLVEEVGGPDSPGGPIIKNMYENAVGYRDLVYREVQNIREFREEMGSNIPTFTAPRLEEDIHELKGLKLLGDSLFKAASSR